MIRWTLGCLPETAEPTAIEEISGNSGWNCVAGTLQHTGNIRILTESGNWEGSVSLSPPPGFAARTLGYNPISPTGLSSNGKYLHFLQPPTGRLECSPG
jgi:hypothetical protein